MTGATRDAARQADAADEVAEGLQRGTTRLTKKTPTTEKGASESVSQPADAAASSMPTGAQSNAQGQDNKKAVEDLEREVQRLKSLLETSNSRAGAAGSTL